MLEIIPAILTNDPRELEEKIAAVEGLVKRVQVDVVDGVFANNKTVDLAAVGQIESGLGIDVHLMVREPVDWVEKSIRAMADRIIGQVEMMSNQAEFVVKVQSTGHEVGLALDLDTPVSEINPVLLFDLDVVLVMSVKAGFGGQEFDHKVLEKIRELGKTKEKDPLTSSGQATFKICVDGGEGPEHIKETKKAGADEIVIGSSLFEGSLEENMQKLQEALK